MGKGKERSFSFSKSTTTVSQSVSVNGRQIEFPDGADLNELAEMLAQSGLDQQMIGQILASTGQASHTSASASNENAGIKVDCAACSRTVVFGKGSCMYCGNTLSLPEKNVARTIDEEILESEPVESENTSAEAAYLNRLKDI
ncbi:MAG: hypothetical protein ACR2QZ_13265 [Woeseiaceae bacterium]